MPQKMCVSYLIASLVGYLEAGIEPKLFEEL